MKLIFCIALMNTFFAGANAQNVAINTDGSTAHPSALLDIKSTNKGLLIPRINLVSDSDLTTISSPRLSLLIYNTNGTVDDGEGFYFWNGSKWSKLVTKNNVYNLSWSVDGNSGTNPLNDFIGTTDNRPLIFKTNNLLSGKIDGAANNIFFGQSAGIDNTAGNNNSFFGQSAGTNNTTGNNNVFVGHLSGAANNTGSNNLFAGELSGSSTTTGNGNAFVGHAAGRENTTGNRNTFLGEDAGINNTIGNQNIYIGNGAGRQNTAAVSMVAVGTDPLSSIVNGTNNVAIGTAALKNAEFAYAQVAVGDSALYSSSAYANTALGSKAMYSNTSGFENTATGTQALYFNKGGVGNTANGFNALRANTGGGNNTATGSLAMYYNTVGNDNTGVGNSCMFSNTTGYNNVAAGYRNMYSNTTGHDNTGSGHYALYSTTTENYNTAIDESALRYNTTGSNNTAICYDAGPQPFVPNLVNTTCIGDEARVTTSNTMVFGNGDVVHWAFGSNATQANQAIEVGTNSTNGNGAFLTIGGTWTNTSSRLKKEDFSDLNGLELLQKIQQMPIQKWKYKGTNEYHIGPVAEDFYKLFGLGTDDKGISTVDPSGIALAAIQEQQRIIEQLLKRIEALEKK